MRAGVAQFACHLQIVLQVVFRSRRVQQVAGIADRALADLAGLDHRIHGDAHVRGPVQAVEDPEHVHAGLGRLAHEFLHHIVGVIGVTHPVRGPQQHLRHQVRHARAQVAQPLPGAFLQEAIGDVEGRAAPAFDREQAGQVRGVRGRDPDHVDRAHPRRQKRLVAVAHRGVGDQEPLLRQHPGGDGLRALALQQLPRARRRLGLGCGRHQGAGLGRRQGAAGGLGMAVDGDVGDIDQELRRPVAALAEREQVRRGVDELGRVAVVEEGRVFQQVDDEFDIRRHAAHPEFAQGPVHAGDGLFRGLGMGGDLDQQRIVEAGDDAPGIGGAAVEPDAVAGGRAIGGDAAVVRDEVVQRVLGRDPALQGVTVQMHIGLAGGAGGLGQGRALGDQDLGLHDVDAGDLLGHGMLDLDARVHLDEVELLAVHIHQEFDGAGVLVADGAADLQRQRADLGALVLGQIGRGRAFDDLLVAALHGAVAFVKMVKPAVAVAQKLHLDVPRAQDHLFQVALAIAEGGLGLAPSLAHLLGQLALAHDRAHAAPAAAPGGFQHQGIADLGRLTLDRLHVLAQDLGRRDHRHAGLDRDAPGAGLVAERAHGVGARPDEGDAGGLAGIDEIGVLAEQAIARMDGVGAGFLRDADDLGDRQISRDRPQPLADAVSLVRLEAVQAQLVLLGIDRHRLLAQLVRRPHHADRNLATVRNQDLAEHQKTFRKRGARRAAGHLGEAGRGEPQPLPREGRRQRVLKL